MAENTSLFRQYVGKFAEVIVVVVLGFGLFIYSSTVAIINHSLAPTAQTYSNVDFVVIVVYEIVVLAIVIFYLKNRGWTFKDFNLDFSLNMIGIAILLVIARWIAGDFVTRMINVFGLQYSGSANVSISFHTGIVSTMLITVVNSFYEEVLLIGYFFKRFEKFHPAIVIFISSIVRASYHTYQGWDNLPMIFIMALVFGLYYFWYKKLWPLVIAHGIGNGLYFINDFYHWFDW